MLSYKPNDKEKIQIDKATRPNRCAWIIESINDLTSNWLFWFIALILVNIFSIAMYDFGFMLFFLMLFLGLLITFIIRNCSSFLSIIFEGSGSKSETEKLRGYNINRFLDKARACEREENYDDAIEYLKAVLEEDKSGEKHVAVRYNIARLYQKLNQPQKAIDEYKTVFKITPKDHPFKRDSYDCIKKLSQLRQIIIKT